ncbi:MAG: hypothetical protein NVSMB51_07150 [Solirubrobacteraceae bacterium]
MGVPATRLCAGCAVPISASAARCTLCGTEQPARRGAFGRLSRALPALLGTAVAAGLVVGGVIASGSGASPDPTHRLFEVRRDMTLVTLVPQGWRGGHAAAPPHIQRELFFDPDHEAYAMTIELQRHARGAALQRARALAGVLHRNPSYVQGAFQRVRFAGGRPAWLLEYELGGVAHAAYLYSACMSVVSVDVDISAPTRAELAGPLAQVPAFTGPRC